MTQLNDATTSRPGRAVATSTHGEHRKASSIVLMSVALPTLILFCALVVDVGVWYTRRAQAQSAADLALLAAMGLLDQTQSYDLQKYFIQMTTTSTLTANGYDASKFSFTYTPSTVGGTTFVSKTVMSASLPMPTFFLKVITNAAPNCFVKASAEKTQIIGANISCAIIGLNSISLSGTGNAAVDSFDSTSSGGVHNPTHSIGNSTYQNSNAHACSNGTISMNGGIAMAGGLVTKGNISSTGSSGVIVGGLTAGGTIMTAYSVSGAKTAGASVPTFTLPSFSVPSNIATVNDNVYITPVNGSGTKGYVTGSNQIVNSANYVLQTGKTYYLTSISMAASNTIILNGNVQSPTVIYLNGNASFKGQFKFNASGALDGNLGGTNFNLKIYGIGTGKVIDLQGGSELYADILAPGYTISTRGNTELYGRILVGDIDFGGTGRFIYDETLGLTNFNSPSSVVRVHMVE